MFQGFAYSINDVDGHDFTAVSPPEIAYSPTTEQIADAAVFSSDEFRMYGFKIQRCTRAGHHDWLNCPYAHHGERAKRRDPRRFNYAAVSCPAFRSGSCPKGIICEFAHGVFEFWLHPDRYRTRACNAGQFCRRKVCFFAHSLEELRLETSVKLQLIPNRPPRAVLADNEDSESSGNTPASETGGGPGNEGSFEPEESDLKFPDIEWISELLQ